MIQNLKELHDAETYYIINKFAKTNSPDKTKEAFESFFKKEINGKVILEVLVKHKKELEKQKSLYADNPVDHPLYGLEDRLNKILEIYNEVIMEHVVSVDKEGNPVSKKEYALALKALELAGKEIYNKKQLELRISSSLQDNKPKQILTEEKPTYQISVSDGNE